MAGTIAPFPLHQYFTNAGAPAASHRLFTYLAGTSTKESVYTDSALSVAHSNPITLNSAGRPTSGIYLDPAKSYKFVLAAAGSDDPPSSPIWTQDNVDGVPPGSTSADADVTGTAGETLAAGECCYLSDGSGGATVGRWYKADADNIYSSTAAQPMGFATTAISTGSSGTFRVIGRVTGLTGLTAGTLYYVSATAGALTSSAPTNARVVGRADSTTTLDVIQSLPDASATLSGLMNIGAQTIAGAKTLSGNNTYSGTSAVTGQATFGTSVPPIGGFGYARKTATTTVNNSTTFVDATDLAFAVVASGEYYFSFNLMIRAATAADMRFQLTGPAAPTGVVMGIVSGNGIGPAGHMAVAAFSSIMSVATIDSTDYLVILNGYLRNGANAGTVQLQFAQGTANASDALVYLESFVRYERRA